MKGKSGVVPSLPAAGRFFVAKFLNPKDGDLLRSALTSLGFNFMVNIMGRLVFGVGINDADYNVQPTVNGKQLACLYYVSWSSMLERCYSDNFLKKRPTYQGCSVCPEWHLFSNFKRWMEQQDWQGNQLDKDLLVKGNKVYSPETCVFVSPLVNRFMNECGRASGEYPTGVNWNSMANKLEARCRNPVDGSRDRLGFFDCPIQAHLAWKKRKHELSCHLAKIQSNPLVANALSLRYQ